ncbi:hypothetical protein IMZ11_12445 [Microtetraspora sp. AC03309]|nr:hypothetical protein [Microtetraspora sp. AC03309]
MAVMESKALETWTGYEGDYERACTVEFVGVIRFGQGAQALILGDEPAATAFQPASRTFVQWIYADPGTDVARTLEDAKGALWEAGPRFDVSGPLVLLDAAVPGVDAVIDRPRQDGFGAEAISLDIAPGRYDVESVDFQPDERTCFRLHRFVPVESK